MSTMEVAAGGSIIARNAWYEILDELRGAAAISDRLSRPDDETLALEANLHVLMLIGQAYSLNAAINVDFPCFVPNFHWPNSSLGNCPDTTYLYAGVDAGGTYRIWGNRGTIHMVDFQIGEAFYGTEKGGSNRALGSVDLRDIHIAEDGTFEFILSVTRPADWNGEWRRLPPTAETINVRQVAYDWLTEKEATLHISRLDPPAPKPKSADDYRRMLRAITFYTKSMVSFPFGAKLHADIRERGKTNNGVDVITFAEAGGLADQFYFYGAFDLANDEALIIDVEVPDPCRYWNIQLSNEFNSSLDYIFHQSSLNGFQAQIGSDGRFKAVIAHKDPGVANWLDTGGVRSGLFMGRWKETATQPADPVITKVKIGDVAKHLPLDTPLVSFTQRKQIVDARRVAVLERLHN